MKRRFFVHEAALSSSKGRVNNKSDFKWYDTSVPCRTACPADTDIPSYLEAISHGDYRKAYEINLEDNVFPEILGRVCSRPCEDACRHSKDNNGDSVAICFSKRAAGDFTNSNIKLPNYSKRTNKKIAVIGSGVAGLTSARELFRYGHKVEIFEKHKTPGGMLNQGIPIFRLPRKIIDREIKQILSLGIKLHLNKNISTFKQLSNLANNYDAVVLAMGTLEANKIDKQFNLCEQVEDGLDFLLRTNEYNSKKIGDNVAIIGGGYTSMDCARTALRLGAKSVRTFYRRTRGDLVILPGELDELRKEHGVMKFNARPNKIIMTKGKLSGLQLIKTQITNKGRLEDIRGSEFNIKTDHIILAIGQNQQLDILSGIQHSRNKLSKSQKSCNITKNIFSAGDFALGATTLIDAIAHAKKTASAIDKFLMKRELKTNSINISEVKTTNRNLTMNYVPLNAMKTLKISDRKNYKEVELGYSKKESTKEATRCYLCHYKFEINNNLCVLCDECLLVKPVENCIVEINKTQKDTDGDIGYERIDPKNTQGIYHGKLHIDHKKCVRCGECEKACPTGAISIQKVEKVYHATT